MHTNQTQYAQVQEAGLEKLYHFQVQGTEANLFAKEHEGIF